MMGITAQPTDEYAIRIKRAERGAINASPGPDHQPSRKDRPMTESQDTPNPAARQPLKNCPFCGGTPTYAFDDTMTPPYGHMHMCGHCATTTGSWPSRDSAIAAWNRRAGEA